MMKRLLVVVGGALALAGCTCAQLPDAYFLCEPDGTCAQPGYECATDRVCRPKKDAGVKLDAGAPDAGPFDAGPGDDAGTDAGFDAGVDAGFDAGVDAGFDAGVDAGFDAGVDAGFDAGFDAGPPCSSFPDLPDDLGLDTNCDGVDGDRTQAVFVDPVGGNDIFDGTAAHPFATLGHALASGKEQVLVGLGAYDEAVTLTQGSVYGGYNQDAGWARDAGRPLITRTFTMRDAGPGWVDYLGVRVANASAPASSAIAVVVINSGAERIVRRCEFAAGKGAAGVDGAAGSDGTAGVAGGVGVSGVDGGWGGAGGLVACESDGGPASAFGGQGGAGATGLADAGTGQPAGGGAGGADVTCLMAPCSGLEGLGGADGGAGAAGGLGVSSSSVGVVDGGWWFPRVAGAGANGAPGTGGAGAGGGGAVFDPTPAWVARGGGGGGGGSAGCGGRGGLGGVGGGASIAMLLIDASPTVQRCTLSTAGGGRGGAGGLGGNGGPGASGGLAGVGELVPGVNDAGVPIADAWDAGAGGPGGAGGAGGPGGRGGGAAGGPSVGIWCSGSSAPAAPTGVTFAIGNGGTEGSPNGVVGLAADSHGCP